MPNIVNPGEESILQTAEISVGHYDDDYPDGLNLRPDSELHTRLVEMVMRRAREAHYTINKKYPYWEKIDDSMTAYVDLSEKEEKTQGKDERKPVSLVIPLSFASVETLLTYFTSVFLEEPIYKYRGVEPADIIKGALTEHLIARQARMAKMGLNLHTQWRDSFNYGFGIVGLGWTEIFAYQTKKRKMQAFMNLVRQFMDIGEETYRERVLRYEGNEMTNIDPYLTLPDPNVSIHEIQKGEFFGWVEKSSYIDLLEQEKDDEDMFNVKFLRKMSSGKTSLLKTDSYRDKKVGREDQRSDNVGRPIDNINMFIRLIPEEVGLGDGQYPEKWFFKLSADRVITMAKPMGLDHDMFPVSCCAPDYDGYSVTPTSRMEILYPMQHSLDWFISSHILNVRKAINDVIVVDPYLINVPDLKDPGPGGIVRLRKSAWGRGVKDAVMQLNVTDITKGHMNDAAMFMNLIQQVGGTDILQTVRRKTSERVSSAEAQNDVANYVSKMGRMARIAGLQSDVAFILASHTSQFMTEPTFVSTVGRYQDVLQAEYPGNQAVVRPSDILPFADIESFDGSMPGMENVQAMSQFLQVAMTSPLISQDLDLLRLFKAVARATGFRNIHEFVKQQPMTAKTGTPEEIDKGVQQGNLVATNELANTFGGNGGF